MTPALAALWLALTGDYIAALRPHLGEEDSPLVAAILTARGRITP